MKRYWIKLTPLFLILGFGFIYLNNAKITNPIWLLETEELNLNSHDNFLFVSRIAKQKSIIGLGESSHGTREFFLYRDRITRQLIENEGFYLVGIETPYTEATQINSYINGSVQKSLDTILKNLKNPFFENIEFKTFIEWARNYNFNSPDRKIKIFGIDTPVDSQPLKELLLLVKNKRCFKEIEEELHFDVDAPLYFTTTNRFNQANFILRDSGLSLRLLKVKSIINSCINDGGESKLALFYVQLTEQLINRINNQSNLSFWNLRDSSMAENVKWVIQSEGNSKAIIWAHNEHIKISSSGSLKYLGYYCRKMFGDCFYSIGMDFGQGVILSNSSSGLQIVQIAALKNLFDNRAIDINADSYFVFLDSTRLNKTLLPHTRLHSLGASYNFYYSPKNVNLFESFNGFLYTKNSTSPKLIQNNE